MECNRCEAETNSYTVSWFNTEKICDVCDKKELAHPKIKEAKNAEKAAVIIGDMNFPGIGKPDDL